MTRMERRPLIALIIVLVVALIGRVALLASGTVSFHSDEAVVGLMARHILQGERPVFFYGQAYMGSLDAWLIAVGFKLLGDSVLTMRIVESVMYLLIVGTGFAVAWRISERIVVATVTALLIAVPNVLLALYTTATLGGYNETLLLGNLILLLAWDLTHEHRDSLIRWALLGLCAGIGWWTNGLIIAYVMPAGLILLVDMAQAVIKARRGRTDDGEDRRVPPSRYIVLIAAAAVFFMIGSAPWWAFNLQNDWAALHFYLPSNAPSQFAGTDIAPLPTDQRLIGLFLLGLPAVIGLRFPWMPGYFVPILGLIILIVYVLALYQFVRGKCVVKAKGRLLILCMIGLFCGLFIVSRFSIDPTGRYFLPLALPLGLLFGTLIDSIRLPAARVVLVVLVVGYQLAGMVTAATTVPPGLTTQFNLETHIPNTDDQALIAFLDAHQLVHGYTNYWVAFRLAFLSGDRMQYSAVLPYKTDLSYTPFDDRYKPYREASDAAPDAQIAYITANVVAVKDRLEAIFAEDDVTYQHADVGVYHIYYDFSPQAPRPPLKFK